MGHWTSHKANKFIQNALGRAFNQGTGSFYSRFYNLTDAYLEKDLIPRDSSLKLYGS